MKLNQLLLLGIALVVSNVFAQQSFPPDQVITGTLLGKTGALRDFATMGPDEFNDPKTHTMIPNISTTQPQLNPTSTVIQNLQTEQGKVVIMPPLQNFVHQHLSLELFHQILQGQWGLTIMYTR